NTEPHPEERPSGRVSKDGPSVNPWFETPRFAWLLTMSKERGPAMAQRHAGAVEGVPRLLLRLEGAALALVAVYAYYRVGGNWWLFAALILVPDVSLLAYFANT